MFLQLRPGKARLQEVKEAERELRWERGCAANAAGKKGADGEGERRKTGAKVDQVATDLNLFLSFFSLLSFSQPFVTPLALVCSGCCLACGAGPTGGCRGRAAAEGSTLIMSSGCVVTRPLMPPTSPATKSSTESAAQREREGGREGGARV